MQCDLWFPPVDVPLGHGQVGRPPVLVMVSGYSRVMAAVMIPSRQAPDLIAGHWLLLRQFGRCRGSWSGIARARRSLRGRRPRLPRSSRCSAECWASRCTSASRTIPRPRDGRAEQQLLRDLVPARPSFTSPDFTEQMSQSISARANRRHHRRWGVARSNGRGRPGRDAGVAPGCSGDRVAGLGAPAAGPLRAPRLQRLLGASLGDRPPLEVVADLARVVVTCGGRVVADHARCWADHQTITDPDHAAAAAAMRQSRSQTAGPQIADEVQQRPLNDYDTVFGLTEAVA